MRSNTVNRIYQGRVVKGELKNNTAGKECKNWESLLLDHHKIFQEAVNYYLLCFAALAKNRPSDNKECPVHALQKQMKEKWTQFNYKGVIRAGIQESVMKYLFPNNSDSTTTLEKCLKKILEGNEGAETSLHKALDELMEEIGTGEGAIQQAGPTFFPMFCEKNTQANFPRGENKRERQTGEYELKEKLLEIESFLDTDENYIKNRKRIETLSKRIKYSWLANKSKRHPEKEVKDCLGKAIKELEQWIEKENNNKKVEPFFNETEFKLELGHIKKKLKTGYIEEKVAFEKTNIKTHIGLLFKHFPNRFTTILMCVFWNKFDKTLNNTAQEKRRQKIKNQTQENKEKMDKLDNQLLVNGQDPIKFCRGERGYIFPAFTAWSQRNDSDLGAPQWKKFDIAAFKEALTVIHQIGEKTKEREKEKQNKDKELEWMEKNQWTEKKTGRNTVKKEWTSKEEEREEPPFIGHFEWNEQKTKLEDKDLKKGDLRIKRLRELLEIELAQEYFGEDDGHGKIPYGLRKRTLRGFNEIRKKWRSKSKNKEFSEKLKNNLKEELNSYQKKNKYIMGSAQLFKELLEEKNWFIWQEPTEQKQTEYNNQGFAENPLEALCDWYELKEDIEKLSKPIQFTPADPEHSRRLFRFGDVASGFDKPSGQYGHDKNSLSFRAPIIKRENGKFIKKDIKIHYSAPRLFRDSLRKESGEELEKMPWLQPMMSAFGFSNSLEQNFSKCNVQLMPDKTRFRKWRFLLNFLIELTIKELQNQIKKDAKRDWQKNCKAGGNRYLKWPKNNGWDGDKKMDQVDWFKKTDPFSCLSVDLGQRTAGAFALIQVNAENKEKSRYIGSAENKKWYASVKNMGVFRLPGENMKFYQKGQLKTEPYGYKGRKASIEELKETKSIISSLIGEESVTELLGEEREQSQLSFPELNDKLLVALRKSQGRLSQYYRWTWMLGENDRKEKALEEIKKDGLKKEWSKLAEEAKNIQKLQILIKGEIPNFQKEIEKKLLTLAGRILPLRGRNWQWKTHPDKKDCHLLSPTERGTDTTNKKLQGQRGLSMKRIEQIEELRCRFQSFNQAQRRKPGNPPFSWSEMRKNPVPDPCPDLLKKLEEIKKQRVNQTAHLILAEALGAQLKTPSLSEKERKQKDIHGEYKKVRDPVDFIVIEDLSRYLTKQDRAPSENSRLMKWSHRAVTHKLEELCEPYGIPILKVPAAYSSKFCSRSSLPGFRAEEVTIRDKNRYPYKKRLEKNESETDDEKKQREFLEKLFKDLETDPKKTGLVPKAGGSIFVPFKPLDKKRSKYTMQADINAAINIGLRAIASPLAKKIHHRIRSEIKEKSGNKKNTVSKTGSIEKRISKKETKTEIKEKLGSKKIIVSKMGSIEKRRFKEETEVKMIKTEDGEKINKKSNFFIDESGIADFEKATINSVKYASGKAIWTKVKQDQWKRCEELNNKKYTDFV